MMARQPLHLNILQDRKEEHAMTPVLAFFGGAGIGQGELLIVAIIALLLFGKRLPEVARSLGKGITEFKKGVAGVEDDVRNTPHATATASRPTPRDEVQEVTAPKFQPPTSAPVQASDEPHA
jgi:sec-independent protein translocase protein TatA